MHLYKKMYLLLFRAITDVLAALPEDTREAEILRRAQQEAEEVYISGPETAGSEGFFCTHAKK